MDFNKLIFEDFDVILRTVLIGVMAYISLVVILRSSGKRSLTQMNAFDFVVTIALGSILASIITDVNITIAQGITAFLVLIVMQYIVTNLSLKSSTFRKIIKSQPTLLYYDGQFLRENMKSQRILETELHQAVRSNGPSSLSEVAAIVMESDGSISVISGSDNKASGKIFEAVEK